MSGSAARSLPVGDLLRRIDGGDDLVLLDLRNDEEFKGWRLEGRRPVDIIHIPYYAVLEDLQASMARLPRGREIAVLCARGGASEMIADLLREAGLRARNVTGGMVAYGDHLEPVPVPIPGAAGEAARFELWQVHRRGKGCLSYVLRAGGEAWVVDPSRRCDWYEAFAARLGAQIVRVLDTHVHADHVSGGPAFAAKLGIPYTVAAGDELELRHPVAPLADGTELRLGGGAAETVLLRALRTPGHTPGSTSYLVGGRWLLSGDTLFADAVGRPDLGGHADDWGRALYHTLRERLGALPDETVVLPAHCGGAAEMGPDGVVARRLGELRRAVPELRLDSAEAFVDSIRRAQAAPPESYRRIARVNLGLETATPEEIAEWELGKNECAARPSGPPGDGGGATCR